MTAKTFPANLLSIICRKKPILNQASPLKRCLGLFDLISLNIGVTIGSGIFLVAGSNIRYVAGPGVILSFLIAAVPIFISALCAAEFAARIPKAGATYNFVYVSIGEIWAALVGWKYISGYMFTTATTALAWSAYVDSLCNGWIRNQTIETVGTFHTEYLSPYPDFLACGIVLVVCAIVASGAKFSAWMNNLFSLTKIGIMLFIISYGFSFADFTLWTDPGRGGFLPFGIAGVMAAAPKCVYALAGFEAAMMAAEEAKNPRKHMILSITIAFLIALGAYILMCSSLSLMVPYMVVSPTSSFADAFSDRGANWAKYVVAIGALCALTTVIFGTLFALPRAIYAASSDGLIFKWLGRVNKRTGVPILSVVITALVAMALILLLDMNSLLDFMSMGFLLTNSLTPASLIIFRYSPPMPGKEQCQVGQLKRKYRTWTLGKILEKYQPGNVVVYSVIIEALIMIACSAIIAKANWSDKDQFYIFIVITAILAIALVVTQLLIMAFEQNVNEDLWFQMPLVPILPSLAMFINILMMLFLTPMTWLRYGIYLSVGALIYFLYGIRHSVHKISNQFEKDSISEVVDPMKF